LRSRRLSGAFLLAAAAPGLVFDASAVAAPYHPDFGIEAEVENNQVSQFRVLVKVSFVLDEGGSAA
jgi:hypothetical protein